MEFLGLVLDLNPTEWARRAYINASANDKPSLPSLTEVLSHCLTFLNAFKLLNRNNRIAVIGAHTRAAQYLYVSGSESDARHENVNDTITVATKLLIAESDPDADGEPLLSGALSLTLCHIARLKREFLNIRPRILVLSVSVDVTGQYIGLMNGIFTAHKLAVPVDSVVLNGVNSLFLQQAANITHGLYAHLPNIDDQHSLLTHLFFTFASDSHSRQHLVLPSQTNIDFRATCFCHRQVVETAMVCPVCLAIYCNKTPRCGACQSKFAANIVPGQARRPNAQIQSAIQSQSPSAAAASSSPPSPR